MLQLKPPYWFAVIAIFAACTVGAVAQTRYNAQVGTPRFHFKDGTTHMAGKCFGVQWFRNRNILIAPLHLLGPGGKRKSGLSQAQLNGAVASIDVMDLTGTRVIEVAKHSLLRNNLPSNHMGENEPGDMMAFELPARCHLPVLGLSTEPPRPPDRVSILTYDFNPRNKEQWRCNGTIFQATPQFIVVKMDQPLPALSSNGAPIVNQSNQLVGMMTAPQDAQRTMITGIPATGIYNRLLNEVGR